MDPKDISSITIYQDLYTVLIEKGYSQAEATEIVMKLIAQAEVELTEELVNKMTPQQLEELDQIPENTPPDEIATKLNLDPIMVDEIRAEKTAKLLSELVPEIDKDDPEIAGAINS